MFASSTLKVEAVDSSETLINTYYTTHRHEIVIKINNLFVRRAVL
jgi:hypothetical protein